VSRLPPGLGLRDPAALVSTWFGAGLLPGAPGTWGSLAALPLGWLAAFYGGAPAVIGLAVAVFFAGLWACRAFLARSHTKDPGIVVVDEVAGQILALAAVPPDLTTQSNGVTTDETGQILALAAAPPEPVFILAAFALFRFFDIVKPWPISWADRRVPGALGVMVDDILAGGATALVIAALVIVTRAP